MVLNLLAEENQIQTYDLMERLIQNLTQFNLHIFFIAERSLLHKILDVLLRDCSG